MCINTYIAISEYQLYTRPTGHSCVLSPYQMSPLYWAADEGHVNIVVFLIEKGANLNSKDDVDGVSE